MEHKYTVLREAVTREQIHEMLSKIKGVFYFASDEPGKLPSHVYNNDGVCIGYLGPESVELVDIGDSSARSDRLLFRRMAFNI